MDFTALQQFLKESSISHLTDEPMKKHTSFAVGGPAGLFITPRSQEQLAKLLSQCRLLGITPTVIGKGSNILVSDRGIDGAVIQVGAQMSQIRCEGDTVFAQAGALLSQVCAFARDNSLTGLEWAYGIPGSVGGAAFMNAGAYGGEIKDVVKSVSAMTDKGAIETFSLDECGFSYRHSTFSSSFSIITEVEFALSKGDKDQISSSMEQILQKRKDKQPLDFPSGGSTFKRPANGYASQLIDECGLKGFRVGGAMVSRKHAGFVINADNASCEDVLAVCKAVKDEVMRQKNILLELEIKLLPETEE